MASQCIGLHRHGKASPLIKSRFCDRGVAVAALEKERGRQPRRPLHLCALEFLELVLQFVKCLFCMLIQMAANLQFHFGNLRIGLLIQSFAAWMTSRLIPGRCSKTASIARMRPSVLSFVMCFNLKIPEHSKRQISTSHHSKRKTPPEEGAPSLALPRN